MHNTINASTNQLKVENWIPKLYLKFDSNRHSVDKLSTKTHQRPNNLAKLSQKLR